MKIEKIITEAEELDIVGAMLLSDEEVKNFPIRLRKYRQRWWMRSPGLTQRHVASVETHGYFDYYGDRVNSDNDAVRPALQIKNLESSNLVVGDTFIFGGKKFEIVDSELAFCLEDIGTCAFRREWQSDGANDYEKSDVKKFVDDWFEEATK